MRDKLHGFHCGAIYPSGKRAVVIKAGTKRPDFPTLAIMSECKVSFVAMYRQAV